MTEVPPSTDQVLRAVCETLGGDKADDVVVIDLAGKTSIADYMVVASGTSKRHIGSMADHILEKMKGLGASSAAVEGAAYCDWVLIDAGDVVVHLFRPEIREFYALERLWGAPALVASQSTNRRVGLGV
jgi:ribosome-associated protein